MKPVLLFAMALLFTSCGTPAVSTPGPTPEVINVYYPDSLQPWADTLSGCAGSIPQVALYFLESTTSNSELNPNDIVLELGNPALVPEGEYIAQAGWEQVAVVVNVTNSISQLSNDKLQQIFTGHVLDWGSGSDKPIQVWVLPDGDILRQIFDRTIKLTQPLAPDAMLAPDPGAMLEAVSKDENAIGYLPQSFLNGTGAVKVVQLAASLEQELHQPVIAITKGEPTNRARNLLACLQNTRP